jgi:phosphoacetylglucosamine mutase
VNTSVSSMESLLKVNRSFEKFHLAAMPLLSEAFEPLANLAQHQNLYPGTLSYGTAGFRANADQTPLDSVMFRVGCLIGLRSRVLGGKICGVMVTASHNGPEDNGVKMVEPDGSMLDASWEGIADKAINARNTSELRDILESVSSLGGDFAAVGRVFVAFDTRSSSERLVQCVIRGCRAVNVDIENYGLLSTPVLHHIIRHANGEGHCITMASFEGYVRMLREGVIETMGKVSTPVASRGQLVVDLAGGVGGTVLASALADPHNKLPNILRTYLGIELIALANDPRNPEVSLNELCGAEYAQKKRCPPNLIFDNEVLIGSSRVASFDGDADRLVYSYTHPTRGWRLLDGDKIATLYALFINTQLTESGIAGKLSVGLVQTAYANGAATHYVSKVIPNSAITISMAKTGVKFVEHEAKTFDIGMYFEANGHGTVIFSPTAVAALEAARPATNKLLGFYKLINQAVGDAISDCLAVEAVLASLNMTVEDWDNLYEDLPSRQGKIAISDRTLIKCTEDETRVVTPLVLQTEIDSMIAEFGFPARAFVRPSGTEDAARVYAESSSVEKANELAFLVAEAAWKLVGKTGSNPPQREDYM